MTKTYPPQLVTAIWEDLDLHELAAARFPGDLHFEKAELQLRRLKLPPRSAVAHVLDAAFFASLTVEEGEPWRLSAVCVIGGCRLYRRRPEAGTLSALNASHSPSLRSQRWLHCRG